MSDYSVTENAAPKYVLAGTEEESVLLEDSGSNHYVIEVSNIGRAGEDGADGANGTNGVGVPAGGATGKVLKKASSADYDTEWADDNAGTSAVWGAITGTLSNQTDLQNALNAKENTLPTGTSAQYFKGDKTLGTLDTAAVPENGNLYFTEARARAAIEDIAAVTYFGGL